MKLKDDPKYIKYLKMIKVSLTASSYFWISYRLSISLQFFSSAFLLIDISFYLSVCLIFFLHTLDSFFTTSIFSCALIPKTSAVSMIIPQFFPPSRIFYFLSHSSPSLIIFSSFCLYLLISFFTYLLFHFEYIIL